MGARDVEGSGNGTERGARGMAETKGVLGTTTKIIYSNILFF